MKSFLEYLKEGIDMADADQYHAHHDGKKHGPFVTADKAKKHITYSLDKHPARDSIKWKKVAKHSHDSLTHVAVDRRTGDEHAYITKSKIGAIKKENNNSSAATWKKIRDNEKGLQLSKKAISGYQKRDAKIKAAKRKKNK